jgi:hypothetical protein
MGCCNLGRKESDERELGDAAFFSIRDVTVYAESSLLEQDSAKES